MKKSSPPNGLYEHIKVAFLGIGFRQNRPENTRLGETVTVQDPSQGGPVYGESLGWFHRISVAYAPCGANGELSKNCREYCDEPRFPSLDGGAAGKLICQG